MNKAIFGCIVVTLLLAVYHTPAVRGRANIQYTQQRIEEQCDTVAECRAVDGRLECWFYVDDVNIHQFMMSSDVTVRPSNLSFEAVCEDVDSVSI